MATNTSNLNLSKPAYTDPADIAVINGNMDVIDNAVNGVEDGLAIVANGNTHAAVATGQFVYVRNHSSLAQGVYKATTAIAANGALSTSNLTADTSGGLNALKADIDTLNSNIGEKADYKYITATSSYDVQTTDAASALFGALPNNYFGIVKAIFGGSFIGACMVGKTDNNWATAIVIVDGLRPLYHYNIAQGNVSVKELAYVTE